MIFLNLLENKNLFVIIFKGFPINLFIQSFEKRFFVLRIADLIQDIATLRKPIASKFLKRL